MIKSYLFILLLITTTFSTTCSAQTYTAENVLAFTRITSVVASPNGKQVALVTYNRSQNNPTRWRFTLSLKNENGRITELTNADYIGSVTWSPDGKSIGFLAAKNGEQILAIYEFRTKKILPIVSLHRSIYAFRWSHSGKQIVFVADEEIKNNRDPILTNVAGGVVNSRLYIISNIQEIR